MTPDTIKPGATYYATIAGNEVPVRVLRVSRTEPGQMYCENLITAKTVWLDAEQIGREVKREGSKQP